MTIEAVEGLIAALQALKREDVAALPPSERHRLCEALEEAHRIATAETIIADAKQATGVLADLKQSKVITND